MDFMRNHKPMLIGIILLFVALIILNVLGGERVPMNDQVDRDTQNSGDIVIEENNVGEDHMSEELIIEDIVVGEGAEAVNGKTVSVHYTGTFTDGSKFDSSIDRGAPFEFFLGAGQVIQGWDTGVLGMKVGGKRKLTIPPSLGYGDVDRGPIPGGSTLIFEVELLGVK